MNVGAAEGLQGADPLEQGAGDSLKDEAANLTEEDLRRGARARLVEHVKEIQLFPCLPNNPFEGRWKPSSCVEEGLHVMSTRHGKRAT